MDIKEIQNLIKFVSKSGVEEVKIEREKFKITIKTGTKNPPQQIIVEGAKTNQIIQPKEIEHEAIQNEPVDENEVVLENKNHIIVKAPMIGTFYRKPAPDKDVFTDVGKSIAEGDVLCVIEAMKLFNEIESEVSGKIVKILAEDQSPVEFDQPLFIIDPS
ncbi:MAG TPA: acetyl-CoA carboxylase biotin carboxyl carrier protein [Flavobacteriaceae bacterium]|nr:acetyl-CoA carboxylase biotin carboxyl carrier protein [Flavobacteriaceae bacterium]